ncbi:MAG: YesL family protein [Oscillibacter sp.]|jgi:uncharacterized membrane protein YesL|nr:YesL family protein [Oscillibacter sp.]
MTPKEIGNAALAALERIADWCIVSAFFLLCCVPVVTAGSACASLYDTAARYFLSRHGSLKTTFFASFRRNWKQGIPLSLLLAAAGILVSAYLYLGETYALSGGYAVVYWLVVAVVSAVAFGVLAWAFPLLSRFDQKTGAILKAAFALAVGDPLRTLGLLVMLAVCGFACRCVPMLLFLLPGIYAQLAGRLQEPILEKHTAPGERPTWAEDEE